MNVKHILQLKGSSAVETIQPAASIRDAVATLGTKRFGALVVSPGDGTVTGILSERDIVGGLARDGIGCLEKPVTDFMTPKVVTCALHETTHSVMERMTSGRFRHMPVMENGKMVGLLSIGDVVKARIAEMEEENSQMTAMLHG